MAFNLPAPEQQDSKSLVGSIAARRSVREYTNAPLSIDVLSQLLWSAQGVTGPDKRRVTPSAGGLYPHSALLMEALEVAAREGKAVTVVQCYPADWRLAALRRSGLHRALKRKSKYMAVATQPCQNSRINEREVSPMSLEKIEDEALHLSKEERAQLIQRLVLSLESPTEEELKSDWLFEARRRAEELDNGSVQAVPGDDVMRKARALIK